MLTFFFSGAVILFGGCFAVVDCFVPAVFGGLAWLLGCREIAEVYGITMRGEQEPVGASGLIS